MNIKTYIREKLADPPLADDFHFSYFRRLPEHGDTTHVEAGGIRCPLKTRGKYKGRPDFDEAIPGTWRSFLFSDADYDAFKLEWSARTGLCWNCEGSGEEVASVSVKEGRKMRTCGKCKGTGKAVIP